jgi:hypothetical protein
LASMSLPRTARRRLLCLSVLVSVAIGCSSSDDEGTDASTSAPTDHTIAFEALAIDFVRAVLTGGDATPFVRDPAVLDDATSALADRRANGGPFEVHMHPIYVDPLSQGDPAGACQFTGDITYTCPVEVRSAGEDVEGVSVLYLVAVASEIPTSEAGEFTTVEPYVVGIEAEPS